MGCLQGGRTDQIPVGRGRCLQVGRTGLEEGGVSREDAQTKFLLEEGQPRRHSVPLSLPLVHETTSQVTPSEDLGGGGHSHACLKDTNAESQAMVN